MTEYHSYDADAAHGLARNPLKAIIAPRPIAWISTQSSSGHLNLAPYSYFNLINDRPPMIMFSSVGYKDTIRNVVDTRQFVVSIVSRAQATAMNVTSDALPANCDEFTIGGVTPQPSTRLSVPGVRGSPAILECRSVAINRLTDLQERFTDTWVVFAQIVAISLDVKCIDSDVFKTELANPVTRAGYLDEYWEIDEIGKFHLER